jgi:hypothetical protein
VFTKAEAIANERSRRAQTAPPEPAAPGEMRVLG